MMDIQCGYTPSFGDPLLFSLEEGLTFLSFFWKDKNKNPTNPVHPIK